MNQPSDKCQWKVGRWGDEPWSGDCGVLWSFNDGGPKENEMNFCPKCGKPLEVSDQIYIEVDDDGEEQE